MYIITSLLTPPLPTSSFTFARPPARPRNRVACTSRELQSSHSADMRRARARSTGTSTSANANADDISRNVGYGDGAGGAVVGSDAPRGTTPSTRVGLAEACCSPRRFRHGRRHRFRTTSRRRWSRQTKGGALSRRGARWTSQRWEVAVMIQYRC